MKPGLVSARGNVGRCMLRVHDCRSDSYIFLDLNAFLAWLAYVVFWVWTLPSRRLSATSGFLAHVGVIVFTDGEPLVVFLAECLEPVGSDPSIQAGSGLRCGRYRGPHAVLRH